MKCIIKIILRGEKYVYLSMRTILNIRYWDNLQHKKRNFCTVQEKLLKLQTKQSKAKQSKKQNTKTKQRRNAWTYNLWCWEVQKDHSSKAALLIQPVYFSFSILLSHLNNHSYLQELIIILIYLLVQLSDSSIHYIITANILLYQAIKQTNQQSYS